MNFAFLWRFAKDFSAKIYFQAIRYRASGRGALRYCKFAKVFSLKIYFQAIRESFLPRKKPVIRYIASTNAKHTIITSAAMPPKCLLLILSHKFSVWRPSMLRCFSENTGIHLCLYSHTYIYIYIIYIIYTYIVYVCIPMYYSDSHIQLFHLSGHSPFSLMPDK